MPVVLHMCCTCTAYAYLIGQAQHDGAARLPIAAGACTWQGVLLMEWSVVTTEESVKRTTSWVQKVAPSSALMQLAGHHRVLYKWHDLLSTCVLVGFL